MRSFLQNLFDTHFQVFDDLGRDNVRFRQTVDILKAVILEPEDVEVEFVPGDEIIVAKPPEPIRKRL